MMRICFYLNVVLRTECLTSNYWCTTLIYVYLESIIMVAYVSSKEVLKFLSLVYGAELLFPIVGSVT